MKFLRFIIEHVNEIPGDFKNPIEFNLILDGIQCRIGDGNKTNSVNALGARGLFAQNNLSTTIIFFNESNEYSILISYHL